MSSSRQSIQGSPERDVDSPAPPHMLTIQEADNLTRRLQHVLNSVGIGQVHAELTRLWNDLTDHISGNHEQIRELTDQVAVLQGQTALLPPGPRAWISQPSTNPSVVQLRDNQHAHHDNLAAAVRTEQALKVKTQELLKRIPASTARNLLMERRNHARSAATPVRVGGETCWVGDQAPTSAGYARLNVTLETSGTPPEKITADVFAHHIAIIANGHGSQLDLTGISHDASHLCHNKLCWNPSHIILELKLDNQGRNSCRNSFVIKCADGTVINP